MKRHPTVLHVIVRQTRNREGWTATCGSRRWGKWSSIHRSPSAAADEAVILFVRRMQGLDTTARRLSGDPIGFSTCPMEAR